MPKRLKSISANGNVEIFESAQDAENATGLNRRLISSATKTGAKLGGLSWQYFHVPKEKYTPTKNNNSIFTKEQFQLNAF